MKIIHCADLHLDSNMTSNLSREQAKQRKAELLATFERMIAYAKDNSVKAVIIAGDLYDKKNISANARNVFLSAINNNPDIKVFLISLKAGGTGLNLIGADMVIHYDPWWNMSAENQATDRAYRIGQKNNVQVYKLITKDSIEEKIYELQQRKAELTDNMLSTQTTFINKLSKDDIMNLFS